MAFKMRGFSAFTKTETIRKDLEPDFVTEEKNKKIKNKEEKRKSRDWEPAFMGGDHSLDDLKKMSTKEIVDYYGMTEGEAKKYSKGTAK